MTYVLDQTSAELRDHMKRITDTSGWDDPLATRLWTEVQALDARLADAERESTDMMWQRRRAEERTERCLEALREAERQIVYLHAKFQATGSGAAVLGRIRNALADQPGDGDALAPKA